MDEAQIAENLRKAIRAARRGHNEPAQRLLGEVVQADPNNEEAWLWLARVVDDPAYKAECLQRVLQLNPDNTGAAEQLAEIQRASGVEESVDAGTTAEAPNIEPVSAGYELLTVQCPNCGSPLDLHGDVAKAVVCPACSSVVDLTDAQARIIGQAKKKSRAIVPIKPGMEVTLDEMRYQVIGWLRYEGWDSEERWRWDEWLLVSAEGEYRWLTYGPTEGFVFFRKIPLAGPINEGMNTIPVGDGVASVKERAPAKVIALDGELTWRATLNEQMRYIDAEKDGLKYSVEFMDDEVELLEGQPVEEEKIWAAFDNKAMQEGIATFAEKGSGYRLVGWAAVFFFILSLCASLTALGGDSRVFTQQMRLTNTTQGTSSNAFDIRSAGRLHRIRLEALNPTNDWGTIVVNLRDARENNQVIFSKTFGLRDDEVRHTFRPSTNGSHRLFLSLTGGQANSVEVRVTVVDGLWAGRYFVIFAVLMAVMGLFFYNMGRRDKPPFSHLVARNLRSAHKKKEEAAS